jgi:hypothetical protein
MVKRQNAIVLLTAVWATMTLAMPQVGLCIEDAAEKPLPKFSLIRDSVLRDFANMTDYQPGDIISRSEVDPIFKHLRQMGWTVTDEKAILGQVPGDSDFVVRQLRSDSGRGFMRKSAGYPHVYDRLYRLSILPGGRQIVHDLIHGKGGDELMEYLAKTQGGANLGAMLQRVPRGTDFNKPTGHIFTADQLVQRLQISYDADRKELAEREKTLDAVPEESKAAREE